MSLTQKERLVIGNRIKELRELKGLKQRDLAKMIGYSGTSIDSAISQAEVHGKMPTEDDKMQKIANILGIHIGALMHPRPLSIEKIKILSDFLTILHQETEGPSWPAIKTLIEADSSTE